MTRAFLAATLVIAIGSFTWSRLSQDPECTEGPCSQDGPLILGAAVWAVLVVAYFIGMIVWAIKVHRQGR